ncbi:hypothetical protein GH733_003226 [Mirounga leonina]|nr:hypothetical protein GH733_003226 [Mirounga leonina]
MEVEMESLMSYWFWGPLCCKVLDGIAYSSPLGQSRGSHVRTEAALELVKEPTMGEPSIGWTALHIAIVNQNAHSV